MFYTSVCTLYVFMCVCIHYCMVHFMLCALAYTYAVWPYLCTQLLECYLISHTVYMYVCVYIICIVRVPVRIEYTMGVCVVCTVFFCSLASVSNNKQSVIVTDLFCSV